MPIVLVGPTASGKTELAVALARVLGGEVVSADSRQVYQELDAGTAKPERDAQGRVAGIPYHLVDFVPVDEPFDAGRFAALAREKAAEIQGRGQLPILAGGTGLYARAFLEGLCPLPRRDEALRRELEDEARVRGRTWLHERLARVDPAAAAEIPANNIQRLVRALEVFELTGKPISSHWSEEPPGGRISASAILRIDWSPESLRQRIKARAELMWPKMLDEVRGLLRRFRGDEPGFQSLGYPEAVACARGELPPEAGLARLVSATNAYARRQRTWFRHQLPARSVAGGGAEEMLRQAVSLIPSHQGGRHPDHAPTDR
ncbi:MAG: tRNA (adenosine(37)-N6)-dimethylallyltransferase MiaA [Elusimicrobia bacterium]|nr:tRNA (adenosine(37)-N6)-dimethylallyltransferase MiaA [Elusimicrobiota bacterium]